MRIGGVRLGWLRRRWWLLVLSTVGVAAVAAAVSLSAPVTYTAESVLVVRSGATENTPGNANEANRLSITYSALIPEDTQIADRVAQALNVPRSDVTGHITGINDANTSILRLRYTADDSSQAVDGARALADALVGPSPASSNFNGLSLSRLPDDAKSSSTADTTIPTGAVLGFLLGLVLIVLWERVDGRFDGVGEVQAHVACPVTPLEELSHASIEVLLKRWYSLANSANAQIAVLPAVADSKLNTAAIVSVFDGVLDRISENSGDRDRLRLVGGGPVGGTDVGELVAQASNLTVLVVPARMKASRYDETLDRLRDLGIRPGWVLFASKKARRQLAKMDAEPAPASQAVPAEATS